MKLRAWDEKNKKTAKTSDKIANTNVMTLPRCHQFFLHSFLSIFSHPFCAKKALNRCQGLFFIVVMNSYKIICVLKTIAFRLPFTFILWEASACYWIHMWVEGITVCTIRAAIIFFFLPFIVAAVLWLLINIP